MKLYDQCVRCAEAGKAAEMARKLGWDGICLVSEPGQFGKEASPKAAADISFGVEVKVQKASDIAKAVGSFRRKAGVLAFRCSTPEMNRLVLETAEADLLTGFWEGGMNHVLASIAKENNVAPCFELQPLMFSHGRQRTELFQSMLEAAKFIRNARAPFVISSGAQMPMDMRDPGELTSLGRLLGFDDSSIRKALSGTIIEENRKRLGGKWVMPGVEIE
jgi:ribonuclease P/MRP protein subunit RPP1